VLYALTECIDTEGVVTAYKVDPETGVLTKFSSITSTGRSTCYISIDKEARHAIISNYWDGKLNVVELDEEGGLVKIVQEHQQTNRETWRQVANRCAMPRPWLLLTPPC
jgi:6-phosphogluconolactonase (cycloisomerase 2 family)